VHAFGADRSSVHRKVTGSFATKLNDARVAVVLLPSPGPPLNVTIGRTRSTVQFQVAGSERCPA
jgi:hypothetical protein